MWYNACNRFDVTQVKIWQSKCYVTHVMLCDTYGNTCKFHWVGAEVGLINYRVVSLIHHNFQRCHDYRDYDYNQTGKLTSRVLNYYDNHQNKIATSVVVLHLSVRIVMISDHPPVRSPSSLFSSSLWWTSLWWSPAEAGTAATRPRVMKFS